MSIRKTVWLMALALIIPVVGTLAADRAQKDLCMRIDMKPILSVEQIRQADLVDFLMELSDLKKPEYGYPEDLSGLTPEDLYKIEVKILIQYGGLPPVFEDVEPNRVVNRRFFAEIMFDVAMQRDEKFASDCGGASNDTEKLKCLEDHNYIYAEAGKIYRNEILSVLCNKKDEWKPIIAPIEFVSFAQIIEINIEIPPSKI